MGDNRRAPFLSFTIHGQCSKALGFALPAACDRWPPYGGPSYEPLAFEEVCWFPLMETGVPAACLGCDS